MSKCETLQAFENGLITEHEALEQAQVESLRALHDRAAVERINNVSASMRQATRISLGFHH